MAGVDELINRVYSASHAPQRFDSILLFTGSAAQHQRVTVNLPLHRFRLQELHRLIASKRTLNPKP